MDKNIFYLVRDNIKKELNSSSASRDLIYTILDYESIVLEESLIFRNSEKHNKRVLKNSLIRLVNEGILDTGYEAGVRWYCFRRECESHFIGKIKPDKEFREQLRKFADIYN